ncbi:MAG: phosphatase PAP2 family protein [Burkholderiaceae bacterium]
MNGTSGLFRRHWPNYRILYPLGLICFCLWLFIGISEEVLEGDSHALDLHILLAMRADGSATIGSHAAGFQEILRDITALGSAVVLGWVTVIVVLYLVVAGQRSSAWFVLLATGSGGMATVLLKWIFDVPRPQLIAHGDYVLSSSFPSGHTMASAVVYLTVGALLTELLPERRLRLYVMTIAVLLTGMVGISRVYLGVHWPTDVLAGWAGGAFWASAWWLLARKLRPGSGQTP